MNNFFQNVFIFDGLYVLRTVIWKGLKPSSSYDVVIFYTTADVHINQT